MLDKEKLQNVRDLFAVHGDILSTAELRAHRLYYADIRRLLEEGQIEKVRRGFYRWTDSAEPEIKIINRLFPDGILCMETALFFWGYSDRTPAEWHIALDKNTSRSRTAVDYPFVQAHRMEPELLPLGKTEIEIDGYMARIYDRDRTICDVLRNQSRMDREIFNKAVQSYVADTQKKVPSLLRYAKELRVQKRVQDMIGVWL